MLTVLMNMVVNSVLEHGSQHSVNEQCKLTVLSRTEEQTVFIGIATKESQQQRSHIELRP